VNYDAYEDYEDQYDPSRSDRQAHRRRKRHRRLNRGSPAEIRSDRQVHRQRKPRKKALLQKSQAEVVSEVADAEGLESGFETTYQPSKYESGWLMQSLKSLYDQALITDVLMLVRGGKEAHVYCCEAGESTGQTLLAAKVYRPRMFRQLRKDAIYRRGRNIIMGDGTRLNDSDFREMRAIVKGTSFGQKLQHTSWLMHEYQLLVALHEAGAAVPKPYAIGDNVILMEYIGDADMAAPTLNTVRLEWDEVQPLLDIVLHHVDLMLRHGWIHGDLSAFNILYWEGHITLIDFPQVVNIHSNPDAYAILQRDIRRVCEYFIRQGATVDPYAILDDLWRRYAGPTPLERAEKTSQESDAMEGYDEV
jgi:RIO kinase 1